jgi:hypothetical protein
LELPFSTDALLKGLVFLAAGVAAFFIERAVEPTWQLAAAGFYAMKGLYYILFAGAFLCLAIQRAVRLEQGSGRIVVRRGVRFFGLVPLFWTYDCEELKLVYVKARDRLNQHAPSQDSWQIRGVSRDQGFFGRWFSEVAVYSKSELAGDFMRQAGEFVRRTPISLPSPGTRSIRLVA